MSDIRKANGLHCYNCSEVTTNRDNAVEGGECGWCGAYDTVPVLITECDEGHGCSSYDHHFGLGKHVEELQL